MTESEAKALASLSAGDIDLSAIKGLSDTDAGDDALSIDEIKEPFLIVSGYVTPTTFGEGTDEKDGFNTHLLVMLDSKTPSKLTEVYSNSDTIAEKITALLEKDELGPAHPVLVKFDQQKTRSGFTVNKLISPSKTELQAFIGGLAKS